MDVLITGSTGMVGKSVLQECVNDKRVKNIYLINRLPVNLKSPKISEFIISDFLKVGEVKKKIKNCDACFHCMGITSFGQNSQYYYRVTYEMTKAITDLVYSINSNSIMTYVSGEGKTRKIEKKRRTQSFASHKLNCTNATPNHHGGQPFPLARLLCGRQ